MGALAIGALVMAAVLVAALFRQRSSSSRTAPTPQRQEFGAVELIAGTGSCAAAKRLAGDRILAAEAPMLPLDGCTTRCRCSYRRYTDRRDMNRRRSDDGLSDIYIYAGRENRSREDRRS